MKDRVIQIEVVLNFLNTLHAKALHFKDNVIADELSAVKHNIYYGDFEEKLLLNNLKNIESKLKKYE
ncbi:MAG: hypothetical protein Q7K54_01820 [Candidatus Parcubacteria bacterium]|nr:hypothetical protein [Candidatus Parcubacteria bacterium]